VVCDNDGATFVVGAVEIGVVGEVVGTDMVGCAMVEVETVKVEVSGRWSEPK